MNFLLKELFVYAQKQLHDQYEKQNPLCLDYELGAETNGPTRLIELTIEHCMRLDDATRAFRIACCVRSVDSFARKEELQFLEGSVFGIGTVCSILHAI